MGTRVLGVCRQEYQRLLNLAYTQDHNGSPGRRWGVEGGRSTRRAVGEIPNAPSRLSLLSTATSDATGYSCQALQNHV